MKMTTDEREFFNYMVSMHMEESGCDRKDAEQNAQFDVMSRKSIGNPPWRDSKSPRK